MPHKMLPEVFNVRSLNELENVAREHLGARVLDAPASPDGIAVSAKRITVAHSDLWFCEYRTPAELSFPESDYVRIQIPQKGIAQTTVGKTKSIVTQDMACISTAEASLRFQPNFCQFVWRISQSAISQKLTALTGNPLAARLAFKPEFDMSGTHGQLLRNLVGSFALATNLPTADLLCREVEQTMITSIIGNMLQNSADFFELNPPALAPRQVKNVEEYIEAHWSEPLDYETLAAISGASVRSLFRTFRAFRRYTPMEFAKSIRLMRARELLAGADRSLTITSIAALCGYSSLSAFSRDFSKAYGVSPSLAREG